MAIRGTIRSTAAVGAVSPLLIVCEFNWSPQTQSPPDIRNPDPVLARTTHKPKSDTLYSGIQTELTLVAGNSLIDWTSRVVDRWTSTSVGNTVSSVTVTTTRAAGEARGRTNCHTQDPRHTAIPGSASVNSEVSC